MLELVDINAILKNEYTTTNSQQVLKAIKSLNKGKALDAHGVSAEHFIHGGEKLKQTVTLIINKIFQLGAVTESMKIGILTPVFKKKGSASDAKNYRGITVTPTITKILETVIRENIQPMISESQHPLQRGFTLNSSPMNCSLLLDEVIREYKDRNEPVYVAFLDAKSAFDVVWHASLMRKLYHIGIEGSPWTVIKSLHEEAKTVVKWDGLLSESYVCQQGVRQGGILSTDLYKIYINDLLSRITDAGTGVKIGEINCGAPTCADDVAIISDKPETLQSLLNIAVDYSEMEKYALQPIKSVVLPINSSKRSNKATQNYPWTMNEENMPIVGSTMHMGIMRSAATEDTAVEENVRKARRTIYSLMASGLHGENGLDPETSVQLMQTYILPVLIYGLEVILPKPTLVERLETVNRKFLKQILSLPTTAGNPAVYILSGTIPIEGTIHKRALSLYGNICRLPESSIEKQVANRQLHVKSFESNSWFIAVKKLFLKYELPDPVNLMEDPPSKLQWKAAVGRAVDLHWQSRIRQSSTMYSSLKHLNEDVYKPGTRHPLIQNIVSERETLRVGTKLKMVTGTYILQVNRASFNQNAPDPTCMLCKSADETLEHFLLCCTALSDTRRPLLAAVLDACVGLEIDTNRQSVLIQIIMDSSAIVTNKDSAKEIEFQSRRLCHALHSERYKRLALVPRKKKQRGTRRHTPY